jgi:plastocyanin
LVSFLVVLTAVAALGSGCSSSKSSGGSHETGSQGTSPAATAAPISGATTVQVSNFSFVPQHLTVTVGTRVTWQFDDSVDHTATSKTSGVFDSGNKGKGQSYTFAFNTPGTYPYLCTIHQFMTGDVTVVSG